MIVVVSRWKLVVAALAVVGVCGGGAAAAAGALDSAPVLGGTSVGADPGAAVLPSVPASVPKVTWPRNAKGQTYGSELKANVIGQIPDLISAIATNGRQGYVRRTDLYKPGPKTPAEAIAQNSAGPRVIPVYAVDGTTVIGSFEIGAGGPSN